MSSMTSQVVVERLDHPPFLCGFRAQDSTCVPLPVDAGADQAHLAHLDGLFLREIAQSA